MFLTGVWVWAGTGKAKNEEENYLFENFCLFAGLSKTGALSYSGKGHNF